MNLKECYISMRGDYEDVMRRLAKEERIEKFLLRTVEDSSFTALAMLWRKGITKPRFARRIR